MIKFPYFGSKNAVIYGCFRVNFLIMENGEKDLTNIMSASWGKIWAPPLPLCFVDLAKNLGLEGNHWNLYRTRVQSTPALVLATYHPDDQQLGWWPNMWVRLEWSEWQKIWGIFKTISEWMNEELLETTRYLSISLPHPSKSCSIIGTNWCTANRPTIWSDTPWWGIKHDTRRQNSTVGWQSSGCRLSPTCRFLFYVS